MSAIKTYASRVHFDVTGVTALGMTSTIVAHWGGG
jgi:hypothetical protein